MMGSSWTPTEQDASQNYSGKSYEPDKLLPNNLLKYTKDTKRIHPTQKPVELLEYLIKTYTNENQMVLDHCAGSASTLVAARNLNRRFLGVENNRDFYDRGLERINQ